MTLVIETPASAGAQSHDECLDIALVNNMPDAALEQTELQFAGLLVAGARGLGSGSDAASPTVHLRRFTLPGVPRQADAAARIRSDYFPISSLPAFAPIGVIVTGSDPREPELTDEPYWSDLIALLEWSLEHAASTIASCLSAHALLLHRDGEARHRLSAKRSGVYDQNVRRGSTLTHGLPDIVCFPHSRHNDISAGAIESHGYEPFISGADSGWTVAAKQLPTGTVVLMQGHPEYDPITLLLEYRRDVRRYLLGERPVYPPMPAGYFSAGIERAMQDFHDAALRAASPADLVEAFPFEQASAELAWTWRPPAEQLYRNWLTELAAHVRTPEVIDAR